MGYPLKVLVCGSREWPTPERIFQRLLELPLDTKIIHGTAKGVDSQADFYARQLGLSVQRFPANWDQYGKRAGFLRNVQMLEEQPDLVLAFWDGKSKGTKHTIDQAAKRGISVEVIL